MSSAPHKALEWLEQAKAKLSPELIQQLEKERIQNATANSNPTTSSSENSATSPAYSQHSSNRNSETNCGEPNSSQNRNSDSRGCGESSSPTSSSKSTNSSNRTIPSNSEGQGQSRTNREVESRTESVGRNQVGLRPDTNREGLGTKQKSSVDYAPLAFDEPSEMYAFFHDDILSGRRAFHKWQAEMNVLVGDRSYTQDNPLKLILAACNGSGKDSFFISPVAVFLAACLIRHKIVITSSSFKQIHTQTEPYIVAYCEKINKKLMDMGFIDRPIFDIIQGQITCLLTGSVIFMFVTDEPSKAEGHHPFDDYADAEMTIIVNEAKSISQEIFKALTRCTGYTRWLEVSSTGKTSGHMYEAHCMSVEYPRPYEAGKWYSRKITVYDCPHISQNSIEEDAVLFGGRDTEFFRSKNLSEYTSIGERIVVSLEKYNLCIANPPKWNNDNRLTGGIDLSGGRDETVTASRRGNKMEKLTGCRVLDAVLLVEYLDKIDFPEHGFVKGETTIYADAGGQGDPIIDMLRSKGWKVIPVLNQTPPRNKKLYKNRGTETWFNFGNAVKLRDVILIDDPLFKAQLINRHYELPDNDKIALLPKKEEKALGNNSPDRADAVVLSFIGYQTVSSRELTESIKAKVNGKENLYGITQAELVDHMSDKRFKLMDGSTLTSPRKIRETPAVLTQKNYIKELLEGHNANRN